MQLLTVTLGANQEYSRERFYAETMQDDSTRVEQLFEVCTMFVWAGRAGWRRWLAMLAQRRMAAQGGSARVGRLFRVLAMLHHRLPAAE